MREGFTVNTVNTVVAVVTKMMVGSSHWAGDEGAELWRRLELARGGDRRVAKSGRVP